MSLSNKLSISDLDLEGKRALIRVCVQVTTEKLLIFMMMELKISENCIAIFHKVFRELKLFRNLGAASCISNDNKAHHIIMLIE